MTKPYKHSRNRQLRNCIRGGGYVNAGGRIYNKELEAWEDAWDTYPYGALIPTMTSDTTPKGVCSISNPRYTQNAYKAFDGNDTTSVQVYNNGYIQYTFEKPVKITKVGYINQVGSGSYSQTSAFSYSIDGNTFMNFWSDTQIQGMSMMYKTDLSLIGVRAIRCTCTSNNPAEGNYVSIIATIQCWNE